MALAAMVKSVVSVNNPLTDASTAPVPLLSVTPLPLLIVRPLKFLSPLPVMACATAPLNVTVLVFPVNVPVTVKVAPATLKL
jgi:hypothetical protein